MATPLTDDAIENLIDEVRAAFLGQYNSRLLRASGRWGRDIRRVGQTLLMAGYTPAITTGGGRKAGKMPPVQIIAQWMRRKGLAPRGVAGRFVRSDLFIRAAFGIAKSIANKGTLIYQNKRKGLDYNEILEDVVDEELPAVADAVLLDSLPKSKYSGLS